MGRPKPSSSSPVKRRTKKLAHPDKPKRPVTGYFYYLSHLRIERKQANLSIRPGDIAKIAGDNWRGMQEKEKSNFQKLADDDKKRYTKEMVVFCLKHKKFKDPNKPKKPATAFFLFLRDFRIEVAGKGYQHKDINSQAGQKWGTLNEEEKKPYLEENGCLKCAYDEALAKYNAGGGEAAAKAAAKAKIGMTDEDEEDEGDEEDEEEDEDDQ